MTSEKINRLLNTAGKSFFILHIEDMIASFDILDTSPDLKTQKIEEYYKAQNGFESKDQYGVRVRVNAVMQIIRAGAVRKAIDLINPDDVRLSVEAQERMKDLGQRLG